MSTKQTDITCPQSFRLLTGKRGGKEEFVRDRYIADADELLDRCREVIASKSYSEAITFSPDVVTACQVLHAFGEITLTICHADSLETSLRVADNGEIIDIWPDKFFEISSYLRFDEI